MSARVAGVPFSTLSRDPSTTFSYPWYGGAVSHLGVTVATSAGVLALASSRLAARLQRTILARYMLYLGIGLMFFGLDDLLLLHEGLLPSIGVPERVFLAVYPIAAVWLIVRYWRAIIDETDFGLLAAALALLATQGLLDSVLSLPIPKAAVEDPLKIAGLVLLLVYGVTTFDSLTSRASPNRGEPDHAPGERRDEGGLGDRRPAQRDSTQS